MLAHFMEFLRDQPVLVFFLVLSLGYLVGNIRVAGISLLRSILPLEVGHKAVWL